MKSKIKILFFGFFLVFTFNLSSMNFLNLLENEKEIWSDFIKDLKKRREENCKDDKVCVIDSSTLERVVELQNEVDDKKRLLLYMKLPKFYNKNLRKAFYEGTDIPVGNEAIFKKTILIRGYTIEGPIDLSHAKFNKPVEILNTSFDNSFKILKSKFYRSVLFKNVCFKKSVSFEHVTFKSDFIIQGTKFSKTAKFLFNNFLGYSGFSGANFSGSLTSFDHSCFKGGAFFVGAKFNCKKVSFCSVNFLNIAQFSISPVKNICLLTREFFEKEGVFIEDASEILKSKKFDFNHAYFKKLVYKEPLLTNKSKKSRKKSRKNKRYTLKLCEK